MNNKLTLRVDESLIASTKDYAGAHVNSVLQMVANYLAALPQAGAHAISPRNLRDFAKSPVRAYTPLQFLALQAT